jgi:hypothetical protein
MWQTNFALALFRDAPHICIMAEEAHPFTVRIDADPLRERRYRWTISEGFQIHLRSPQSYATEREAKKDADRAMSKFVLHWRNRE